MLTKDSEVRGKPLQLGRTYHRRRTLGKMKTAGKATGNHLSTEYTATPILLCRHAIKAPLLEYHP